MPFIFDSYFFFFILFPSSNFKIEKFRASVIEKNHKRKEEQMRQVREKAAAANEQARIRASLVQASRKTPERNRFPFGSEVVF